MDSDSSHASCLIVGCGYVGKPLADSLLQQGWRVGAIVKSAGSAAALAQAYSNQKHLTLFQGDISKSEFWHDVPPEWDQVVYCPSTGGGGVAAYRQIHEHGLLNCMEWMSENTKLCYTSSTSVYGQDDGSVVDETSPTEPLSESGRELVAAERRVCDVGQTVLRLGGIYGPERGVLLKRLLAGKAMIPEQHPKWLNLIFLRDILSAIEHGLSGSLAAGEVYNVIDDEPASYQEIYHWLCEQLQIPLPPTGTPDYFGKRGITNKQVSNQKLKRTGWYPEMSSFREGYTRLLNL